MRNIILLIVFVMFGCKEDNTRPEGSSISTHIELSIQNSTGKDLLDPNVLNHFEISQIKIFSLENGEKKLLDDGSNPSLISNERGYYTIHLNTKSSFFATESSGVYLSLIQLSENITDTIKTEWKAGKNYFYNTKMWYNDELRWETDKTEFPIKIIK